MGFPHSGQNFMFPGASCPSGHFTVCEDPHSPQNFRPGETGLPHFTHGFPTAVVSAPQLPQNFMFTGLFVPHFGHGFTCCWVAGCIAWGICWAMP